MSPKSDATVSTVRTVDDVLERLSVYESAHGELPLRDAKKKIHEMDDVNETLREQAAASMTSPSVYLGVICPNAHGLLQAMTEYGVALGGTQATSMFYPLTHITGAPWDFYCDGSKYNADGFVNKFKQMTIHDVIEDTRSNDGKRVVHFKGTVNGAKGKLCIRIYIAPVSVFDAILDLGSSHQQTILTASCAICFWPRLVYRKQYRVFDNNMGQRAYPHCKTKYSITLSGLQEVKLRNTQENPSIYGIADARTEFIAFENEANLPNHEFVKSQKQLQYIVYAVSTKSTRYLGTTADMK